MWAYADPGEPTDADPASSEDDSETILAWWNDQLLTLVAGVACGFLAHFLLRSPNSGMLNLRPVKVSNPAHKNILRLIFEIF